MRRVVVCLLATLLATASLSCGGAATPAPPVARSEGASWADVFDGTPDLFAVIRPRATRRDGVYGNFFKALVRAENGHEAYLAIIAEGVPDPQMFALLLDCVPGVAAEDWQPEPSPLAEMDPGSGEIIWSTLFPSEVANEILDLDGDD